MKNMLTQLFKSGKRVLRVAVLFSGNAGSAQFVQKQIAEKSRLKNKIQIVCALTDKNIARGIPALEALGIPIIKTDFKEFCASHSLETRDLNGRKKYFEFVSEKLKEFNPDILMLSGFMKIITEPLLSEFENRIINVHPADLSIMENGKPKFTGDNAVKDAINAGEKFVRSSVHIVLGKVDCGPVIVLSKPIAVSGSAEETQEILKREGDDPAFLKALELIAEGKVAVECGNVFIEGKKGFFKLS